MSYQYVLPGEIEKRSFEILTKELGDRKLLPEKKVDPVLVIGVPVGFVNVVESKEEILKDPVPYIVARGRKGGSNVAAAICNALLYTAAGRTL